MWTTSVSMLLYVPLTDQKGRRREAEGSTVRGGHIADPVSDEEYPDAGRLKMHTTATPHHSICSRFRLPCGPLLTDGACGYISGRSGIEVDMRVG